MNIRQRLQKVEGLLKRLGKTPPSQATQDHIIYLLGDIIKSVDSDNGQELMVGLETLRLADTLLVNGKYGFTKSGMKSFELVEILRTKERYLYKLPPYSSELDCILVKPISETPLLQTLQTLTILVDDAPNLGNQASAVNLKNKVRQIGFAGKIQFIYPKEISGKFESLNSLKKGSLDKPIYLDKANNVEFSECAHLFNQNQGQRPHSALSMSAALDAATANEYFEQSCRMHDSIKNKMDMSNFARALNTDAHIFFSPHYRKPPDTAIYLQDEATDIQIERSQNTPVVVPVTTYEQAKSALVSDKAMQKIVGSVRAQTILNLMSSIDESRVNFFSMYGTPLRRHLNFVNLLMAAKYAQLKGPADLRKPLVIGLFTNIPSVEIDELISSAGKETNIQRIESSNPAASQHIQSMKPLDILILQLGSEHLPKPIFDGLFTHNASNVWPPVREGAGTLNTLLTTTGRPHIHCPKIREMWGWGIDLELAPPEVRKKLEKVNSVVCAENNSDHLPAGEFIIEAQNPDSDISKFFKKLKEHALNPDHDRIKVGIKTAMNLIRLTPEQRKKLLEPFLFFRRFNPKEGELIRDDAQSIQACSAESAQGNTDLQNGWKWTMKSDPLTGRPVYDGEFMCAKKVIARTVLYNQPSVCRSADSSRNNVLVQEGVLENQLIPLSESEICPVLPPTLQETGKTHSISGAKIGFMRGMANVHAKNPADAKRLFFTMYFYSHFVGLLFQESDRCYPENETLMDTACTGLAILYGISLLEESLYWASKLLLASPNPRYKTAGKITHVAARVSGHTMTAVDTVKTWQAATAPVYTMSHFAFGVFSSTLGGYCAQRVTQGVGSLFYTAIGFFKCGKQKTPPKASTVQINASAFQSHRLND